MQTKTVLKLITLAGLLLVLCYFALEFYVSAQMQLAELAKQQQATQAKEIIPSAHVKAPEIKKPSNSSRSIITLTADGQGHFRGEVLINNIAMPFLIDTGATRTVIPEKMAAMAHLPIGKKVETNTAGGKVFAYQTEIDTFMIQGVQIKKLNAQINPYLHEVLIGMSTLKYFNMTLNGPHLTLVSNGEHTVIATQVEAGIVEQKPAVIIKRKRCDKNNVCRTVYSDF